MSKIPRIHLLDVAEPLLCFNGLRVRCQLVLASAAPVWMFRDDFKPTDLWLEGFNTMMVCRKCLENPPNTAEDEREYLYGLVEAQNRPVDWFAFNNETKNTTS